jgi:methionine synthase reductase
MKEILITYGSQTGNAEGIAKDLYDQILASPSLPPVQLLTLNAAKKVNFKEFKYVLILCSTTGNGDAPENAEAWWRSVKLRSAPRDMFDGVEYTVLGLGDTNYDKYCHMGKSIFKRLSELGAKPTMPLCCADEATGLEETIEKWKVDIINHLNSLPADTE